MRTPTNPPHKQNKVHNITNPNDPNTKVPITNTPLPQQKQKEK